MTPKSSTAIWMPIFLGDHYTETYNFTVRQQGAYVLLMLAAWRLGGVLPADEAVLAEHARLTQAEWAEERGRLAALFEVSDSEWRHERLVSEWQKAEHNKQVRQQAGNTSAAKRRQRPNPSPSPSPSSEAKASADLSGVVFDLGLRWLADKSGRPEAHCRSLLGKWRKAIGSDAALIELLSKAQREGVIDPVPWMERAVGERAPPEKRGWN